MQENQSKSTFHSKRLKESQMAVKIEENEALQELVKLLQQSHQIMLRDIKSSQDTIITLFDTEESSDAKECKNAKKLGKSIDR